MVYQIKDLVIKFFYLIEKSYELKNSKTDEITEFMEDKYQNLGFFTMIS